MLSGMVIPGDMIEEEEDEESTEGTSSDGYRTPSPGISHTPPPSGGKARKKGKTREPFYKVYGVVYLPGDIKGLTDKLHLLLAEFFAGNTTVRNELEKTVAGSLQPQLKKASIETGGIDINALIDGSGIVLDQNDWENPYYNFTKAML